MPDVAISSPSRNCREFFSVPPRPRSRDSSAADLERASLFPRVSLTDRPRPGLYYEIHRATSFRAAIFIRCFLRMRIVARKVRFYDSRRAFNDRLSFLIIRRLVISS